MDSAELVQAQARLHVGAVPTANLPCRENEFAVMADFVRERVTRGQGGCMFVSGVPGTGKTASVRAVAEILRTERDSGALTHFKFVEINGMALTSPHNVYVLLLFVLWPV